MAPLFDLILARTRKPCLLLALLASLPGCGQPASEKPATPAPKRTAAALPEACLGTFTGETPGYSMRDQEGNLIRINGNSIDVPAIGNTVVISRERIHLTQEADGRVVRGSGPIRILRADAAAVVVEAEIVQRDTARPTYRITFELTSGAISMTQVGLRAEPPATPLVRAARK
jgi:hypothetical protein